MPTHPQLEYARRTASVYRIRRSERGWHLWRFYAWSRDPCGWQVIVADLRTRDDAEQHLLKRLGLTEQSVPDPLPAKAPAVAWGDAEWL